jgi:hypothetical protein
MQKKLLRKIKHLSVYEVDPFVVRDKYDIDFTDTGDSYMYPKFIPKNELWVCSERDPGETKFRIAFILSYHYARLHGLSYDAAYDRAESAEAKLRKLWDAKHPYTTAKIELLKKVKTRIGEEMEVWLVDGNMVRCYLFQDYVCGGHPEVYSWIPPLEIWIDNDLNDLERETTLLHELREYEFMKYDGESYADAHNMALKIELAALKKMKAKK